MRHLMPASGLSSRLLRVGAVAKLAVRSSWFWTCGEPRGRLRRHGCCRTGSVVEAGSRVPSPRRRGCHRKRIAHTASSVETQMFHCLSVDVSPSLETPHKRHLRTVSVEIQVSCRQIFLARREVVEVVDRACDERISSNDSSLLTHHRGLLNSYARAGFTPGARCAMSLLRYVCTFTIPQSFRCLR